MHIILVSLIVLSCSLANPTKQPKDDLTNASPQWEGIESPVIYEDPNKAIKTRESIDLSKDVPHPKSEFSGFSPTTQLKEEKYIVGRCEGPTTTCVPYNLCENGEIITDGSGLLDIRLGETVLPKHGSCTRYREVCCRIPGSETTTTTLPPSPRCGIRNEDGVSTRIVGLNETQTQFGEFPWMVAILLKDQIGEKEVNLYLCGGSLIAPNIVLTAAHCVQRFVPGDLKVRAGEWDTQTKDEIFPHQDESVNITFIHPEYNGNSLKNDIAILILNAPFIFTPNVNTICLPEAGDEFLSVPCVATGWGKDQFGIEGQFQNILKQVTLPIVPNGVCENALRTTRLGEYFVLDASFLCAGGTDNVDTCKGDGGSPLACPQTTSDGTVYFQAGIVAWGIGCGENGIPGVYANVVQGINWIKAAIAPFV